MASTGAKATTDNRLKTSAPSQKYSVASAISSSSSKLASRKIEKQNEPVKLDDEGKVVIPPILGSNVLNSSWTIWFMNRGPGVKISNYLDATKELESFSTVEEFWQIYTHLKRVDRLPFTSEFQVFRKGVKPMWEDPVNANGGKWVIRFKRPFKTYSNNLYTSSTVNSANNSLATTPTSSHALLATVVPTGGGLLSGGGVPTDGTATPTGLSSHGAHRPSNQARLQNRLFWEKLLLAIIGGDLAKKSDVDTNEITGAVMSVRKDEDILSVWTRSGEHGEGNSNVRKAMQELLDLPESQVFEFKIHSDSIKEGAQKQALYNNNMLHSNNNSSTNLYHTGLHHQHQNHGHSNGHYHNQASSGSSSNLWGSNTNNNNNNNSYTQSSSNTSSTLFGNSNGNNNSLNNHHHNHHNHHNNSNNSNHHNNHHHHNHNNNNSHNIISSTHINAHHPRHNNLQQLEATASILRSASPSLSSGGTPTSSSAFPSSRFTTEAGPISAVSIGSSRLANSTTNNNNGSMNNTNTSAGSAATSPVASSSHKSIW